MSDTTAAVNRRILVIDDTPAIHEDIRKVLCRDSDSDSGALDTLATALFGDDPAAPAASDDYSVDTAEQGETGCEMARRAAAADKPYALAFIDMRMPPGWDGLQTIEQLWHIDPRVQVVICSAYSDHSWDEIQQRLGDSDQLLILKKPFDPVEVAQLAHTLTHKWSMQREVARHVAELDARVAARTRELSEAHERLKTEVEKSQRIEEELRLAQKLEAVGQLAAGIAHEINTPVQFVGDSVHFLREAGSDLLRLVAHYREGVAALAAQPGHAALLDAIASAEEEADLDYLREQLPRACERAIKGIDRVGDIVRAMREFSHPDQREKTPTDLNKLLQSTLAVARNEYKYVADVETDFAELPDMLCHPGELGQVFLNLLVNAAQAIGEQIDNGGERGRIVVGTALDVDRTGVLVRIADNGGGIPENIRHRVFEQFFTTKAVGKGTGQGLAMARRIVQRHGGHIDFDSQPALGTTFSLHLPLSGAAGTGGGEREGAA